jgi:hypothetical protein
MSEYELLVPHSERDEQRRRRLAAWQGTILGSMKAPWETTQTACFSPSITDQAAQ